MNTSKLFLLLDYLNEAGMINSVSRALRKEFTIEDTLESKLWNHIKKYIKSKQKNYEKLDKTYILINIFNNDIKSLNRTHSRLYKRIKSILVYNYINNKPIIEDW